jgi:hypothetical protein
MAQALNKPAFLKLTPLGGGEVHVSASHVVSITKAPNGSNVSTTAGTHNVKETPEQILGQLAV